MLLTYKIRQVLATSSLKDLIILYCPPIPLFHQRKPGAGAGLVQCWFYTPTPQEPAGFSTDFRARVEASQSVGAYNVKMNANQTRRRGSFFWTSVLLVLSWNLLALALNKH